MIPLTPEQIKTLRDEVYEDSIDNGYAATIMLSAFDLIEGLRLQLKDLEAGRKAWENKAHELQAEVQELESKTGLLSPPSIEQCQAEARAAKAKIKELQAHIDRRCECGELVDYPENVHCGACA